MRIRSVSWGRTKTQDFQAEKAEVTIELEENDSFDEALAAAKAYVDEALGEAPSLEDVDEARRIIERHERVGALKKRR